MQFSNYNLAQREIDSRAINFYQKRLGMLKAGVALMLEMNTVEAPLTKLAFAVPGDVHECHAVLTAVHRRAFA